MSTKIRNIQLAQGRNKRGETFDRHIQFQPGMEDLVNIVAGLQKDVKRINDTFTLAGAQRYARKHGPNWSAHEEDITGPDGNPDGIKEVFVADGKGNVKVINGYTLGKSTYPQRKLYHTAFPTRDERKQKPYNQFLHELHDIKEGAEENGYLYENSLNGLNNINEDNISQFVSLQPIIKARDYFKQIVFAPVYESIKRETGFPPMLQAQLYNKALATSYNQLVRDEVLKTKFNINVSTTKPSKIAKIVKSPTFQQYALDLIRYVESGQDDKFALDNWRNDVNIVLAETMEEISAKQ